MRDLEYAIRFLTKRWAFTGVATVVLALGIGLTATMFAIIDGVVLRGPDYRDVDRIAYLQTTIPQSQYFQQVRIHDYLDWRERQTVFDEMAAYSFAGASISGDGSRAERFRAARISHTLLDMLGVGPFMGRGFTEEEELSADPDVVILGYHVWVNRYDRDPNILGRTLRVNARPTTVVGVMPAGFRFPENQDMWLPLAVDPSRLERREGPGFSVIGRMSEGVDLDMARARMTAVASQLEAEYPEANRDIAPVVRSWKDSVFVGPDTRGLLYTMFVAVVGVLLIACANVANLLFALTMARGKELAVRTAMGAERGRVIRQLLLESLVLSGLGAILGVGLTWGSLGLFERAIAGLNPPAWMTFDIDGSVLLFVVGAGVVAAFAAGLMPALHATRSDVAAILRDQSRGSSSHSVNRWSAGLVGLEVALSCALLVGAGLTVRSTLKVGSADLGARTDGLLVAGLPLPAETYPDSAARIALVKRFERDLQALPGVRAAAVGSAVPGLGTSNNWYGIRDREYANDAEYSFAGTTTVSPDYFDVFDIPILAGRTFTTNDGMGSELVVIVDQRFADKNWPGEEPLGRQVRLGRGDSENPWMTVVGLVPTVTMSRPTQFGANPPESIFVPTGQRQMGGVQLVARAGADPRALAPLLREMVAGIDADIPISTLDTHEQLLRDSHLEYLIIGGMFSIFGAVALLLASVGLYAVMAYSVSRRQTEVGVRMAMGADAGRIVRLILLQGSRPLGIGLLVGLLLAVGLGRALSSQLFGVSTVDPLTFGGVPVFLTLVSLAALLGPATRASRIAPVVALRED